MQVKIIAPPSIPIPATGSNAEIETSSVPKPLECTTLSPSTNRVTTDAIVAVAGPSGLSKTTSALNGSVTTSSSHSNSSCKTTRTFLVPEPRAGTSREETAFVIPAAEPVPAVNSVPGAFKEVLSKTLNEGSSEASNEASIGASNEVSQGHQRLHLDDTSNENSNNLSGNSNDNSNESSANNSNDNSNETSDSEGENGGGPMDLQESISSSSSVLFFRNPDEEQSAIISSSSNEHWRRDSRGAKRISDVSSSTSVTACPSIAMPSTAPTDECRPAPTSAAPSVQNSPDQTHSRNSQCCEGTSSGSNVTSAEISIVSSPTPEGPDTVVEEATAGVSSADAVESSDGTEVSSAVLVVAPSGREEVTSAENSPVVGNEVTSAASCPEFEEEEDPDGNEAGPLVSELVVDSDSELGAAEAVIVHSEDLAEITCSSVDVPAASQEGPLHLDRRPLSVSSTEETEGLSDRE